MGCRRRSAVRIERSATDLHENKWYGNCRHSIVANEMALRWIPLKFENCVNILQGFEMYLLFALKRLAANFGKSYCYLRSSLLRNIRLFTFSCICIACWNCWNCWNCWSAAECCWPPLSPACWNCWYCCINCCWSPKSACGCKCMKFEMMSIGTGNTIVLLCSAEILFSVCRYRSLKSKSFYCHMSIPTDYL